MKREVIDCDSCGVKNAQGTRPIYVWLDRKTDAAGSADDIWDTVDMCPTCMASALCTFLDGKQNVIGHVLTGRAWLDRVRKQVPF